MHITLKSFLVLCLLAGGAGEVQAQFWKKKPPPPRVRPPVPRAKAEAPPKPKKPRVLDYPPTKIRSRYRVDVLLPLYLDELVADNRPAFKDRLPEKALAGYNFYEGLRLAADTLSKLGYNLDIQIHDITQSGTSPEQLVKLKTLVGSDLIIGAVQSGQIPVLAEYARKSKVNFISALSPSDADVQGNPFFTIIQPTLRTHCRVIRNKAIAANPGRNIPMIMRTGSSADSAAVRYTLQDQEKTFTRIVWTTGTDRRALERLLDTERINPLVVPVLDADFADTVLASLQEWFPQHRFEIYGMPTWRGIASIRKSGAYPLMQVVFSVPFHYDPTTVTAQTIASQYRRQSSARPGEMVYRGYELLYWSAYLLQQYGTVFNARMGDTGGAAFTPFDVKPQWTQDNDLLYHENEHVYLMRYQEGSFTVEK